MLKHNQFKTISIKEMDQVSLLNRVDTKYVISKTMLARFLQSLEHTHRVLEINSELVQNYETFYFDTAQHNMYLDHHNKKANRYKVRIREYIESNLFFLEIKNKSNKGRTIKKRMKLPENNITSHPKAHEFIKKHSPYTFQNLNPVLGNTFKRITLVDHELSERLTIDVDLKAWSVENDETSLTFDAIAIVELKRDGFSNSKTHKLLLDLRVHPMGYSKYAIASSVLFSKTVKNNNFKKKHRFVEKIVKL